MRVQEYSTKEFEETYTYEGEDLGAIWTKEETRFRLWAPEAEGVELCLYASGDEQAEDLIKVLKMEKGEKGTWIHRETGDLNETYYTYRVEREGRKTEACDPYARTTGANGVRAMVLDLASTNPEGWGEDGNPNRNLRMNDAIIYELHVRDLGADPHSRISMPGKFLSLTEHGTKTEGGQPTGIDYIRSLGITHLHLLPVYDYGSVDETSSEPQFNWGYDPVNFNVPEGSYATDPFHGKVRVREFKEMVQSLHRDGISVVMDVVYNHVFDVERFCFNCIVPQYFSRVTDGVYSNGSACGNDTASERSMVRKYIVDSILYWTKEYHIDGFRFDLVGLIDVETIRELMEKVHKIRPDVIFYGEGWTLDTVVTKPDCKMTTQTNAAEVPGFAFFSDTMRDGLRVRVFNLQKGYLFGAEGFAEVVASCFLGQDQGWCNTPAQSVSYASCHDNHTLFDRLGLCAPEMGREEKIRRNLLAAAVCLLAQGIPFFQAGEELLRTKRLPNGKICENSYNQPDEVNAIQWSCLEEESCQKVLAYYKGLIAFRKAHGNLRLATAEAVTSKVRQLDTGEENLLGFEILSIKNAEAVERADGTGREKKDGSGKDVGSEKEVGNEKNVENEKEVENGEVLRIYFWPGKEKRSLLLPEGEWKVYVEEDRAGCVPLRVVRKSIDLSGIGALVIGCEK